MRGLVSGFEFRVSSFEFLVLPSRGCLRRFFFVSGFWFLVSSFVVWFVCEPRNTRNVGWGIFNAEWHRGR